MGRTEGHDDPEVEEGGDEQGEEVGSGRKQLVDLNVAQVAGAGAATLTAATAASAFNVYGTVIGTAVMAVLSTAASPWLSHWFSRSGQQAKEIAGKAVGHPHGSNRKTPSGSGVSGAAPDATGARVPEDTDPTRTTAMPVIGSSGPVAVGAAETDPHRRTADEPNGPGASEGAESADGDPSDAASEGSGDGPPRRSRRAILVSAAAVFVLVMLVILVFELLTGRSLTSWTRGGDEPTAPTLLGGTTSAPPAEEDPRPDPTGEDPDDFEEQPGPQEPGTEQPEDPEPGQEPPTDGEGGTGQPPGEGDEPQDPGGQDPGQQVPGEQEPGGGEPAPEDGDPGQGDGGPEPGPAE